MVNYTARVQISEYRIIYYSVLTGPNTTGHELLFLPVGGQEQLNYAQMMPSRLGSTIDYINKYDIDYIYR